MPDLPSAKRRDGTVKTRNTLWLAARNFADRYGGRCLNSYVNAHIKMRWQCEKGHIWEAVVGNIARGHWCPSCSGNRKLTIEQMQQLAVARRGKCLSLKYLGNLRKLRWQCAKGHVWETIPEVIRRGGWCPTCVGRNTITIQSLQDIAKTRGGACLSTVYRGPKVKLPWRCDKGHTWEALPSAVKRGNWCGECRGGKRKTIYGIQHIAEERGGKCLSSQYVNAFTKLKFACKKGHVWQSQPASIRSGTWCPMCAGNQKLAIEDMRELAKGRDGTCLSKRYVNVESKLRWRCAEGHIWKATPAHIKNGTWCPYCGGTIKYTLSDMRNFAREKGGRCLSTQYHRIKSKLKWQCSDGHTWESSAGNIVSGTWCPKCVTGVSERICRAYMEAIFSAKFLRASPDWLVGNKGNKFIPDGYNEMLRVGFEYNGIQHFEEIPHFHKRSINLQEQKVRDAEKRRLYKENNAILIEVPYFVAYEEMGQYIIDQCKKYNINVPMTTLPDYKTLDIFSRHKLSEMQDMAKAHGGKCLSRSYVSETEKIRFRCVAGHTWETLPSNVKKGVWCGICARKRNALKRRLRLEEIQNIAIQRNGKCISKEYLGNHHKLQWQCEKGHIWEAPVSRIKTGAWCPNCAGNRKLTIQKMQEIAHRKEGECLSKKYVNARTKLKWKCQKGHTWQAMPDNIKHGQWCPTCARNRLSKWIKKSVELKNLRALR